MTVNEADKRVYYGTIKEIWELDYVKVKVALFRCAWIPLGQPAAPHLTHARKTRRPNRLLYHPDSAAAAATHLSGLDAAGATAHCIFSPTRPPPTPTPVAAGIFRISALAFSLTADRRAVAGLAARKEADDQRRTWTSRRTSVRPAPTHLRFELRAFDIIPTLHTGNSAGDRRPTLASRRCLLLFATTSSTAETEQSVNMVESGGVGDVEMTEEIQVYEKERKKRGV
ncbi:uncharacterized protein LOC125519225 [Triticum urartu]|uniref:uncharacterized protein LOC125519225 n=1 Tax=Triticum urartu TaxID=4572 RepID=UPI002043CE17|nr:uncharacterized protein LOC125519225 [Triticum urartu]